MNMPLVLLNRRRRAGGFSPQSVLFGLNEPGIFLDPSDQTTLFQDAAGTTPVAATGQSVGLALDKSQGLVLGPELRASGAVGIVGSATSATYNSVTGQGSVSRVDVSNQSFVQWTGLVSDGSYRIAISCQTNGVLVRRGGSSDTSQFTVLAGQSATITVQASASPALITITNQPSAGSSTFTVTSFRELPGFHATQATTASRPLYALLPANGVRNLANGSADVGNNSVWATGGTSNGITVTKIGSGFDTDGLPYADYTVVGTATANSFISITGAGFRVPAVSGQTFVASILSKLVAGTQPPASCGTRPDVNGENAVPTITESFTAISATVSSTETTQSITGTLANAGTVQARPLVTIRTDNGATVNYTVRIKALQFELGSTRTAYQFNYANTNIAQPPFAQVGALLFDGVDDFLQTPSIDFSATNKVTVFAGVRKLSDAARGTICDTGFGPTANYFRFDAPGPSSGDRYRFIAGGSAIVVTTTNTGVAPDNAVVSGIADIAGDSLILRRNGAQLASSAGNQGTGNFANAFVNIGRSSGTANPFNGYLYSLIVRGAATTQVEVTATETWVAGKTGVTL